MKRIALDTTGKTCSVALQVGDTILDKHLLGQKKHAESILGMIEDVLKEADLPLQALDAIAFGRGPGSFTGIRIAASVTQGLAISHDLPVVAVSSLQALAQGVYREEGYESVYSLFDACMGEVYFGRYALQNGLMKPVCEESLIKPCALHLNPKAGYVAAGLGCKAYEEILSPEFEGLKTVLPDREPLAYDVLTLSKDLPKREASHALPVYLRDNVAKRSKNG